MKMTAISNGEKLTVHINPYNVCTARMVEGKCIVETADGGVWEVSERSYKSVIGWMECYENIARHLSASQRVDTYRAVTMRR